MFQAYLTFVRKQSASERSFSESVNALPTWPWEVLWESKCSGSWVLALNLSLPRCTWSCTNSLFVHSEPIYFHCTSTCSFCSVSCVHADDKNRGNWPSLLFQRRAYIYCWIRYTYHREHCLQEGCIKEIRFIVSTLQFQFSCGSHTRSSMLVSKMEFGEPR